MLVDWRVIRNKFKHSATLQEMTYDFAEEFALFRSKGFQRSKKNSEAALRKCYGIGEGRKAGAVEYKVGLQNGKPQQRRIIVRTRDLPPLALLLVRRAAEVAMATDRRKLEPTLPFPRMQAPGVSLSCVK